MTTERLEDPEWQFRHDFLSLQLKCLEAFVISQMRDIGRLGRGGFGGLLVVE
jgi:hypothetical protein